MVVSQQHPQPNGPILVPPTQKSNKFVFSIGSMMVITFVVAIVGLLLGRMFIAVQTGEANNVGYFAILAAVAPTAALVGAGTTFRLLQWMQRQGK